MNFRFSLIELMIVVSIIGILAAVFLGPFMQQANGAELPKAVQRLQDNGGNFVYKHQSGQLYLLDSATPDSTSRPDGWISPRPGVGYIIQDDELIIIGDPTNNLNWYCFDGISEVTNTRTSENFNCGN